MLPAEFLFLALFFWFLERLQAKAANPPVRLLKFWTFLQLGLFVIFTFLNYVMDQGFMTIFELVYLLSLRLAWGKAIRMKSIFDMQIKSTKQVL